MLERVRIGSDILVIALGVFVASAVITRAVLKFALTRGVLDIPNERSSHQTPTPRGGGVAIVLSMTLGLLVLAVLGHVDFAVLMALCGGGGAVAAIGFVDDRRSVSPGLRLAVHFAASLWALAWLGGVPPLLVGGHLISFGWWGYVLGALCIAWGLNLFNFMDGIDGLAASEAIFVACSAAILALAGTTQSAIPPAAIVFGAACGGFLIWNWPKAKIFMGDVGSGYLGYCLVVMAMAAARESAVALWVWLILAGVFFVDATVTILRRMSRGERLYEPHRNHAYQWLARHWGSHRRVTLVVAAVNILWLLPCAFLVLRHPSYAAWIVVAALAPVLVGALVGGAGRREG